MRKMFHKKRYVSVCVLVCLLKVKFCVLFDIHLETSMLYTI